MQIGTCAEDSRPAAGGTCRWSAQGPAPGKQPALAASSGLASVSKPGKWAHAGSRQGCRRARSVQHTVGVLQRQRPGWHKWGRGVHLLVGDPHTQAGR